jgi:hypothetical protein
LRWLKWSLVALGLLLVAGVAVGIALVTSHRTECYADFPSVPEAESGLAKAHANGLDDPDLLQRPHSASIRFTSGETGDDAQEFRQTVRRVVHSSGGHLEENTPCIERPYFD